MDLKNLGFAVFGIAAFAEIVALILAVFGNVHSILLFFVIGLGALTALGALGLFVFEEWRHPSGGSTTH